MYVHNIIKRYQIGFEALFFTIPNESVLYGLWYVEN